jgi:hypothetical protein
MRKKAKAIESKSSVVTHHNRSWSPKRLAKFRATLVAKREAKSKVKELKEMTKDEEFKEKKIKQVNKQVVKIPSAEDVPGFKEDYRKTNPSQHLLDVKQACLHIQAIDSSIQCYKEFNNTDLDNCIAVLGIERNRLIKEKAVYADAQEILDLLKGKKTNVSGATGYLITVI